MGSYVLLFIFPSIFCIAGPGNIYFLIPTKGDRYFFVPSALVLIAMMASSGPLSQGSAIRIWPVIAYISLGLGLINGIEQFYQQKRKIPSWPNWQDEVAIWRTEPRYVLHIWPDSWFIQLKVKNAE